MGLYYKTTLAREGRQTRKSLILILLFLAYLGCGWDNPLFPTVSASIRYPAGRGDWVTTSPEKEGMDGDALHYLMQQIQSGDYGPVHDILIVHNGKLVWEKYFRGHRQSTLHTLQSETKSVTSLLIGIALAQKKISSLDAKLLDLLPRRYQKIANLDEQKRSITLEHILSMTAGFDWDESSYPYTDRRNYRNQMRRSRDDIRFVLDKPMAWEPGTRFAYNSGCSMLLSVILKEKTGLYADEFARRYLFEPLRFKNYRWQKNRQGYPDTSGGLYLRPRDIAKLGLLMLHGGEWNGLQIVPAEWVRQSVQPFRLNAGLRIRYGYQWWLAGPALQLDACDQGYCMKGYQGQYLLILPDKQLVVVSNAWGSNEEQERALFMGVLAAVVSPADKTLIVKRQSAKTDTGAGLFPGQAASVLGKDIAGLVKSYDPGVESAAGRLPNLIPDRGKSSLNRRKVNEKARIDAPR